MTCVNEVTAKEQVAGNVPWRDSKVVVTLFESRSACGTS